jgi:hypothetical protein
MTPKERAAYIVDRFKKSLIAGRKEDIATLIEIHVQAAEEEAVANYLAEQERLQLIKEARCTALEKAREAKVTKRNRKESY